MSKRRYYKYRYKCLWVVLGVLALVANHLLGSTPEWVDRFYFRGLFQGFRWLYDHSLAYIPIPMVYVTLIIFIIYAARIFTTMIIMLKSGKWLRGISEGVLGLAAFLGGALFFFYVLWGFNYNRPDIYTELGMTSENIDSTYLIAELDRVTDRLVATRALITQDSMRAINESDLPDDLESIIRVELEKLLQSWGIPTYGRVRVRKLLPKGILLRFSTAGVYVPYALEGHIDGGLHPIQWPFTMAHEMSHGYGYGDEGTCNFTGYLACMQSDHPVLRYSALRGYWRYLMSDLRKLDKALYRQQMNSLPRGIKTDLNEIIKYMDRYPDIMPAVRNKVYDNYLKSHGVKAGLANYSHMIKYVKAYGER